ncbi:MAG TPA: DUF5719 family protein [Acidimicrobiales bacterium]|nr:DUF5719 family protein [Acidimicrobiales bacterium]
MTARRTPVLLVVAVLLAAGGVADRSARPRDRVVAGNAARALMPTAAPAGALSSSWFCVGATAASGSGADGVVEVANPTTRPAAGTVTVVPVAGEAVTRPLRVAAMAKTSVTLRDLVQAPWAAAVVDVDSGQVAAELVVHGSTESDATPCSSRASDHWHFADGATAKDASLALSLFNPFPEDAIVDLSFSTDQGRAAPAAFRPIVVPAHALVVREIGDHVRRREAIATDVAVRTGRVVAVQTQTRSAPGKAGLSVSLGAPSLGALWEFPVGVLTDGVDEHYAVSNPGSSEATVLFDVILDEGVAEDFERSVPAGGRLDVVLNEEVGVPRGVNHSLTVRSLDGVPVVVSRALHFAEPAPQRGRADTIGLRRPARRWLFAAAGPSDGAGEWIVVANTGSAAARISVTGLDGGTDLDVEGLQGTEVRPGRRAVLFLNDHVKRPELPVVVRSTVPVFVERLYSLGAAGVWIGPGIPLD